jgi:hypothetical protein
MKAVSHRGTEPQRFTEEFSEEDREENGGR